MKTALMLIATGQTYHTYARNLIVSAKQFFPPHDVILFTDSVDEFDAKHVIPYYYFGYPSATYHRYHAFTGSQDILSQYDQVFFSDVDMCFVAPVSEGEIFSSGITATEHPGYVGTNGTPETNPFSAAYCPHVRQYFCGGFNGGNSREFLQMSEEIVRNIIKDETAGVEACWVDESHMNRYLYHNPPVKILTPSFCYPEDTDRYLKIWEKAGRGPFEPKLVALDKGKR